ncbi:MAG: lysine-2,3-aminomutase-like protein [Micropepsaceae bacterium]
MLKRRHTLTTPGELVGANLISEKKARSLAPVSARYAIAITPAIIDLIDPNDPNDPIARQFVPSHEELKTMAEERADPIGDDRHSPVRGIVHRYADRVLFKLTHICPVYCRFCFRREMVGGANGPGLSKSELDAAFNYIADHSEIWEVILTGGDPLVLSPRKLRSSIKRLDTIEHVKIIRWHTRMPVAKPDAITKELVAALKSARKTTYLVLHANHPRELTDEVRAACAKLVNAGIILLSQSVLLKGVNNDADTLIALMRALIELGVKPYYLHHADLAPGTSHFRTTIAEGQSLMRELHARASGLCLPSYVLDIPGGYAKAKLELCDAQPPAGEPPRGTPSYLVRDGRGGLHPYPVSEETKPPG